MASAQWLLNDTSVVTGAFWTAESGSSYKLENRYASTLSRTTTSPTPYEGAGCYQSPPSSDLITRFYDSSTNQITGGTYYVDFYAYIKSSPSGDGYFYFCGNDTAVEYSSSFVNASAQMAIATYDNVFGYIELTQTSSNTVPRDAWFRFQGKVVSGGFAEAKLYKGTNINGATADNTLTSTVSYSAFEYLSVAGGAIVNGGIYFDNIKFDNTAYPTRGTAHTASGTSTITATGTAAMRNARVGAGSATGTATGTGAASRGQSVTGSASVTASATAGMSSTQVIGASGTGTATGTASASVAGVVTISGSATITGTGTSEASVAMAQTATATGTVIATSSVDFIVIPPITLQSNGTVIADSSGEMAKTMPIESTGTATGTSQADATHTYYIFKPPTREISPLSLDPYYELVGYFQGRTLVKRDGVWKLVQNRQEDWLDQCEYVFRGGCENRVTGAEKAELESAGYTVETRTS